MAFLSYILYLFSTVFQLEHFCMSIESHLWILCNIKKNVGNGHVYKEVTTFRTFINEK